MAKLLVVVAWRKRVRNWKTRKLTRSIWSFVVGRGSYTCAYSLRYPERRLPHNHPSLRAEHGSTIVLLMNSRDVTSRLRESVWNGSIPLEVRLHNGDCRTYDESDPYMV